MRLRMTNMVRLLALACGGVLLALCVGCGTTSGSTGSSTIISGSGLLMLTSPVATDGRYADTYHFTAPQSGTVSVSMSSGILDAYVIAWNGTASAPALATTIGTDDNGGGGTDAKLTFPVTAGSAYSFWCSTSPLSATLIGPYSYTVVYQ